MTVVVPPWLQPLVDAVADVRASDLMPRFGTPDVDVRRSAVLALFGETSSYGPDVLLIQKTAHLRSHAGQPAFPGGGIDPADVDASAAALREAQEETGLDPSGVAVLAVLPELWLPPSGNAVTPVLAWWRAPSEISAADPHEVAAVARVPVADLTDPANRLQIKHPSGYVGPAFRVADMLVWGFTAGVLDRLLDLGGWTRPWDESRVENLPDDLLALAQRSRRAASPSFGSTGPEA